MGLDVGWLHSSLTEAMQHYDSKYDEDYTQAESITLSAQSLAQKHSIHISESDIEYLLRLISEKSQSMLDAEEILASEFLEATDLVDRANNEMYRTVSENEKGDSSIDAGPVYINVINNRIEIANSADSKWNYNEPADKLPDLVSSIANSLSNAIELANGADDILGNLAKVQLVSVLEQAQKEINSPFVDKHKWKDRRGFLAGIRMGIQKITNDGVKISETSGKLFKAINKLIKELDAFLGWFF